MKNFTQSESEETTTFEDADTIVQRRVELDAEVELVRSRLMPHQMHAWEREAAARIELENQLWELREELANRDEQLASLEDQVSHMLEHWDGMTNTVARYRAALGRIISQSAFGNPEAHWMQKRAQEAIDGDD